MASALLALPGRAQAHPHAFIDVQSTIILDAQGRISGIEQEWLFDEFYTIFITEDVRPAPSDNDPRLKELAKRNLSHMREKDYFLRFIVNGIKIKLSEVIEYESMIKNGKLWMKFQIPFNTPIEIKGNNASFSTYDETYYIEMLHKKKENIAFRGSGAESCSSRLITPRPTADVVSLAGARDKTAEADTSLGQFFAETVIITCR